MPDAISFRKPSEDVLRVGQQACAAPVASEPCCGFRPPCGATKRRVYLPLPDQPKVRHFAGTVNGMPYRGAVESIDGSPALVLGPAWRRCCGLEAGDRVRVELEPEGPQRRDLAPDLAAAIDGSPAAAAFWDDLAQFYRRAYLGWIDSTKRRPRVRAERIAVVVALLERGVKERP